MVGLAGRDAEIAELEAALTGAAKHGAALLVIGEAGIGKTSLLDAAVGQARSRGYRVLTVSGVESESQLPYAGLHQLLQPVLETARRLPVAQRSALRTALGMRQGKPPELFLVALATPSTSSTKLVKTGHSFWSRTTCSGSTLRPQES